MGKLILVGAGPGNPGLITVKGLAAIRAADAIVYDRLVAKELLREARPGCALYDVGKTPLSNHNPQDETNALLADLATRHECIVRLKGGDPFVFGRGGEELAYLRARGIACETIPGVTSAVAVPELAGIPVTHRGAATAFRVITAHGAAFSAADLDYASMRDEKTTLVFLMGFSQLAEIASRLIAAGRAPSTPAAVIASGTTAQQRAVRGPLGVIAATAAAAELSAPAVIIVGDVVAFGRRCLVGHVGDRPSLLAQRLRAAGATVTEVAVGRIRPLAGAVTVERLARADWLVATSANALRALADILTERGDALAAQTKRLKVAAIGQTTAAAAERLGWTVALVPEAANAASLLAALRAHVTPDEEVLRLLSLGVKDSLAPLAACCRYEAIPIYENEPVAVHGLSRADYDEIYATSPVCLARLEEALGIHRA